MKFPPFAVACGEEGSDPLVVHGGRVVRVDQYAASRHMELLDRDLGDVADLGVRVWRYGMPWRLAEPSPGVYDWTRWDRALDACRRHGLEPVVDLCHFGLPDHFGGFCEPDWVDGFINYVEAFLARYPEPRWFTPVNEPGITALFSARMGMWNDRLARTTTSPRSATSRSRISKRCRAYGPIATAGGSAPKDSAATWPIRTMTPGYEQRPMPAICSRRSGIYTWESHPEGSPPA